jgi:hypothetical protein
VQPPPAPPSLPIQRAKAASGLPAQELPTARLHEQVVLAGAAIYKHDAQLAAVGILLHRRQHIQGLEANGLQHGTHDVGLQGSKAMLAAAGV